MIHYFRPNKDNQLGDKTYFTTKLQVIQDLINSFNQLLAAYSDIDPSETNSELESYSSDESTMTDSKSSFEKLNDNNYASWKVQIHGIVATIIH